MKLGPPTDPTFAVLDEPEACGECHSVSRLTNGLCLNCLLRGALDEQNPPPAKEAFKEALAAVKSWDGDWHIADHEILDEIARGGMGVVYRAREPHSGRIVALKCVLAYQGDSDQALARFRREAETAARLDHPNIVPIYQVGETADGFPYYTMKYARAGSLLQARHPLLQHPRQSVELMAKVARAVHYAHEKGVLHRDLKPGNILLDGHGEPLVSDFGLARCESTSSCLTRSLASFGTPGYIAPEQAEGPAAQLTPAADIYSLGAILFELLTGRPPFVGDNAFVVMKQSAEDPAPKVRRLARHVDRDVETICARCLEREPADRYQSAASLADDLKNWLNDRPIVARPTGRWLRFLRWFQDNRKLSAVLAAFLVLAVVSAAWQVRTRSVQAAMQESILASRSVVVLPFLDLDHVVPEPVVAQSLASSLQERLSAFRPARVRALPSESSLQWARPEDVQRAGQESNARMVLTGTVRTVQARKRIAFRLLAPATGEVLLTYFWEAREPNDPIHLKSDFVSQMNEILGAKDWSGILQAKADPALRNEAAMESITAGRGIAPATALDHDRAINLFRKALEAEPNSSLAHSYLAIEATARTHYNADRRFLEIGKAEATEAIRLSPESPEAHRAMAGVYYQEGQFSEALEEELRTLEIGGLEEKVGCFIGLTLDTLGRSHHALQWYALASRMTGTLGDVDALIGDCWAKLGDDERAIKAYSRAAELRPGSTQGLLGIGHVRLLQANFEEARKIVRSGGGRNSDFNEMERLAAQIEFFTRDFDAAEQIYSKLALNDADGGGSFYGAVSYPSALGRIKEARGDMEGAKALLNDSLTKETAALNREPENSDVAYRLSAVEASLGLSEASFRHLHKAIAYGWVDYRSLALDPRFDSLRANPEFETIVKNVTAKVADLRATTRSNH